MTESFVDQILQKHKKIYEESTEHPLTNELVEGKLADYKLFVYLVQDVKFFDVSLKFMGKLVSLTDAREATIFLSKQLGLIAGIENDYFDNTLRELRETNLEELKKHCPSMLKEKTRKLPQVKAYLDYIEELIARSSSYTQLITCMFTLEQVYLGWANYHIERNNIPRSLPYRYKKWIDLHSGPDFETWVGKLKDEVNRVATDELQQKICEDTLQKVIKLETDFFDACYYYKEN